MRNKIILILISLILVSNLAYANIIIEQPKALYSLGDNMDIKARVSSSEASSGFLKLSLNCGDSSEDFYLSSLSLGAGEEKTITTSVILTRTLVKEEKFCNVQARYNADYATGESFQVSTQINIDIKIEPASVKPGEKIKISGSAFKDNSENVNGNIEIEISSLLESREVKDGKFSFEIIIPNDIKSGNHDLTARVYERKNNEVINSGEERMVLNVKQIPNKLDIEINKESLLPGEEIIIKGVLYDQSNEKINGDLTLNLYDSFGDLIFNKLVKSQQANTIKINNNETSGYLKIEGKYSNLTAKRLFYVEEKASASFTIENDTLIITNIGNIAYEKPVQIVIAGKTEIREIDLDIGESRRLRLLAPDGNYEVRISDGSQELKLSGISLTGNVIGIEDVRGGFSRYPIVWLFLIVVFGMFILLMIQKVSKKKFFEYTPKEKKERIINAEEVIKRQEYDNVLNIKNTKEAEYALVLKGNKEDASLLSLKLKNLDSLKKDKESLKAVENALEHIYNKKGSVYKTGEYIIGILTPSLTKTFKNEIHAINIASEINKIFKDHNNKPGTQIDFGIGVNSGDIVVKNEGKLKFTSLANTLNLAKKLSNLAEREVLLSKRAHDKTLSEIKVERKDKEGTEAYTIKGLSERDSHKKFIDGFLDRNR